MSSSPLASYPKFRLWKFNERTESWQVVSAYPDDARENYEDGTLEEAVEQFSQVQEVEETA